MKPKVILYTAASLDGRTTGFSVDMGLFYSLAQRWSENASLVGCDTLLNVPDEIPEDEASEVSTISPSADDSRPILVVPDSRGRLKSWHYWREQPYWKDFISLCTKSTPPDHVEYLKRNGIKTITAGKEHVNYRQAFDVLHRQFGTTAVRVDSGGTLNGVLLRAGLVDELHLLVHPTLVGGITQKTFFRDAHSEQAGEIALRFLGSELYSERILLLSYAVVK
ncbi:5-amino-6-(5-phosphoribosylamino)uracil reductase [Leptolyngbya sp. Heron Island J]|uniref:dihydrofolate reductase family protein n=1 Tax=Leptolyngbya sp. Heron Island J TaxID=1385935 RepID=UPI0003B95C0C|nr:dihydrofolate reductase family protein [Leptolyngbya sp. Heron Island J]ESA35845.1 5-amino-6-(5-phosphoribosylamino)uracil reductase [Leptolyngbya sp. Heron Island J]